jgi:hypothetical protein
VDLGAPGEVADQRERGLEKRGVAVVNDAHVAGPESRSRSERIVYPVPVGMQMIGEEKWS